MYMTYKSASQPHKLVNLVDFEDGGFAIFAFMVHGDELRPKFNFLIGVRRALQNGIGIHIIKPAYQHIQFEVGLFISSEVNPDNGLSSSMG